MRIVPILVLTISAPPAGLAQCLPFPQGFVPFAAVAYVTTPLVNGDRLVVGSLTSNALSQISQIPLPIVAGRQFFCNQSIQLAPGQSYEGVYVPTADERAGNHSDFAGLLVNPQTNQPFPGGIIPASILGSVYAWRIAQAPPSWNDFNPGTAVTSEVLVNDTQYFNPEFINSLSPVLSRMSDGRLVVAWNRDTPSNCYLRAFRQTGNSFEAVSQATLLNPNTPSAWKFGPVVVPLTDGGVGAFYGHSFGTKGQRFDDHLTPVGGEIAVPGSDTWPDATVLPGGDILLLSGGPTTAQLTVYRYDRILRPIGSRVVNQTPSAIPSYIASIVAASNGNYTVAWHAASGNIVARSFNASDQPLGPDFIVNTSSGGSRQLPTMAYNSRNDLFIAWEGSGDADPDGIYMRRFNSAGSPLGPEVRVNQSISGPQVKTQMSAAESGEVVLSWTGRDGSAEGVFARIYDASGVPITDEFQVNRSATGVQQTALLGGRRGVIMLRDRVVFAWSGSGPIGPGIYLTTFMLGQSVPALSIRSVVNAASNLSGPIAPGEIVALYGSGLGPEQLTLFHFGATGTIETQLASTQVFFNDIPAPIIYTSATQVAAIVPYSITGSGARVVVTYQGRTSSAFLLPIAASAPGIFTFDSSGKGQVAAVNQDGSLNTASSRAKVGEIISLFATGEGQTTPPGLDGKPASLPLPRPNLSVSATIGGRTAGVQYAGGAFGLVAGLIQINVQIPSGIEVGSAVPVVMQIGNVSSQNGVTISVAPN